MKIYRISVSNEINCKLLILNIYSKLNIFCVLQTEESLKYKAGMTMICVVLPNFIMIRSDIIANKTLMIYFGVMKYLC